MDDMVYVDREPVPDGYAIVAYPGLPFFDALVGGRREIVPFYGRCHIRDFYGSPNHPLGEVQMVANSYQEAVAMYKATMTIRSPLIRMIGRLVTGT